jgi:SH3-like domain-containing protein
MLHIGEAVPLLAAPNDGAASLAMLDNVSLLILNRTSDGRYLLVEFEDQRGWIASSVDSDIEGNLNAVPVSVVLPTEAPTRTPMVLTTGPTYRVLDQAATLYRAPFPDAEVLTTTMTQISLPIVAKTRDDAYLLLEYNGQQGWILLSENDGTVEGDLENIAAMTLGPALAATRAAPTAEGDWAAFPMFRVGGLSVSLRAVPDSSAPVVATVSSAVLPILGKTADESYLLVEHDGQQYWLRPTLSGSVEGSLEHVPVLDGLSGEIVAARPTPAASEVTYRVGGLGTTLRAGPSANAAVVVSVRGATLPVLGKSADGNYLLVEYEGQEGWLRVSISGSVQGDLDDVPVVSP